jgi:dihydroneopterin aldolase
MAVDAVRSASVRVDKPGALRQTDSVSVEIAADRAS